MNKNILFQIHKIFWIFLICSIIGYCFEVLVWFIKTGHLISHQGLIYGPFIQAYGIGSIVYLTLVRIKNPWYIFMLSFFLGGFVEYSCSYIQEMLFTSISWDYSKEILNIQGRTGFFQMLIWGFFGLLFIKVIYPETMKLIEILYNKKYIAINLIMILFMIFDVTISFLASNRQKERYDNIPATSELQKFLDKHYPDELMHKIYKNTKQIPN